MPRPGPRPLPASRPNCFVVVGGCVVVVGGPGEIVEGVVVVVAVVAVGMEAVGVVELQAPGEVTLLGSKSRLSVFSLVCFSFSFFTFFFFFFYMYYIHLDIVL